jgi:hypothetical protein
LVISSQRTMGSHTLSLEVHIWQEFSTLHTI